MTSITTYEGVGSDLLRLVSFPYLAQQNAPLTDIGLFTTLGQAQCNRWSASSNNTRGHIASDIVIMISSACEGGNLLRLVAKTDLAQQNTPTHTCE